MHPGRVGISAGLALALALSGCSATTADPSVNSRTSDVGVPVSAPAAPVSRSVAQPEIAISTAEVPDTTRAPAGPVVPDVVTLAWLGHDPQLPGVVIRVAEGIRWQGPVPGEYAIRAGGRFQWFGANGSAVACVDTDRCVGVDAAGHLAVLAGSAQRWVYDPDGRAIGRFTADGKRRSGAVPTFAVALRRSGADLAALLERATRPVPYAGGITGDPHVLTAGGLRYSTQLTGEFQARTGDPDRTVQVRLAPLAHQSNVSVVTAAAIGTRGSVFEYDIYGRALVAGVLVPPSGKFQNVSVPGGPEIGLWAADERGAAHAAVVWADGSSAVLTADPALGLTVVMTAPHAPGIGGLFGDGNQVTTGDLLDRQGAALDVDTVVRDWQLRVGESLFAVPSEPVAGFPRGVATPPDGAEVFAETSCRTAGLTDTDDVAACVLDVGVTGDEGFTVGHLAMTRPATAVLPAQLTARYPAMADDPTLAAQSLPEILDVRPGLGQLFVYDVPVTGHGRIAVRFGSDCSGDGSGELRPDHPAFRLFDSRGKAVSRRLPTCGRVETPTLLPGRYRLMVAGPTTGEPVAIRLQLDAP